MPDRTKTLSLIDPFADLDEKTDENDTGAFKDPFAGVPDAHPAPPGADALLAPLADGRGPQEGVRGSLGSSETSEGGKGAEGGAEDLPEWASESNATQPPTWCAECGKRQYHSVAGIACINGHGEAGSIDADELEARVRAADELKARREEVRSGKIPQGRTLWDDKPKRPEGGDEAWIPDDSLASLAARGYELCLAIPCTVGGEPHTKELWIVPETSDQAERNELSYQDLATLANCLIAFPGAKVTEINTFEKAKKK